MNKQVPRQFNGPAILAAMFRELDPPFRKKLYEKLCQISPIIARTVEQLEFVYSDIIRLEDQSLQLLLRSVSEKDWLMAFRLTGEDLKARLLANMSANKRDDFSSQLHKLGKQKKTAVVRVQMQIAKQAREMLIAGKLRLRSRRKYSRHPNS